MPYLLLLAEMMSFSQSVSTSKVTVKQSNRKSILDFMRESGEVSVAEISEKVKISKPTVKKVVDYYIEKNMVLETGKGSSSEEGGKKPNLFTFNNEFGYIIALHIGPDFIYTVATDLNVEIRHSFYENLPKIGPEEVVDLLIGKVRDLISLDWTRDKRLLSIVIALPGIVNPETGVSIYSPHFPDWGTNFPFRDIFLSRLGIDVPTYIDGVNRYQAVAEKMKGAARDAGDFMIVDAMDEGVGAGVVSNNSLKHGSQNFSGEIGHMVLQADGPPCICGGKGCFEALVSVKRINELLKAGYTGHENSLIYRTKHDPDVGIDDLFGAAAADDAFAVEVLDQIATWFAIGLNNVIMVNDPEMIVIQGIYTKAGQRFQTQLRSKINQMSYPRLSRNVKLVYSDIGRERGVLGAGCYAMWRYFQNPELYSSGS